MQTPWLASIYYLTMQVLLGSKWFAPSHPSGKAKSMAVREMAVGREMWDSGTTPVRGIKNLPWSPSAPLPTSVPFPLSLAPFPSSVLQLGALSCLGKCFKCRVRGVGPTYIHTRKLASMALESLLFSSLYIFSFISYTFLFVALTCIFVTSSHFSKWISSFQTLTTLLLCPLLISQLASFF